MAEFGGDGSPRGLLAAVVVSAGVGTLVALPALRLRGIYLALATLAFAVFLDRWVFTLQRVRLFGFELELFSGGTLSVPRLDVAGVSFDGDRASTILAAAVFAAVGTLVIGLRRSRFGRRLVALRTSPTAAATVGVQVTRTKILVFALSAAIAGLGGALVAGMRGGSSAEQFGFVESLVLLMVTAAGGVSLVGGALFAGFSSLGFKVIADIVPGLSNAVLLLPAAIGIALGRHPDGAVSQLAVALQPLRRSPVALAGLAGGLLAMAAARQADLIANWPFALLSLGCLLVATAGAARAERGVAAPGPAADRTNGDRPPRPLALERRGIDAAWTPTDRAELDAILGLGG